MTQPGIKETEYASVLLAGSYLFVIHGLAALFITRRFDWRAYGTANPVGE